LLNLFANKIIFHPRAQYAPHRLAVEEITFKTKSGADIHGVYVAPAQYMDTILLFHGNAVNITYYEDFAEVYSKRGYGILIFDYRGFGKSEGKITAGNIYEDSIAAVEYLLKEKKTAPSNIILWGHSFGNAPAIETALRLKDYSFKALVLQSPFTNIPQMAGALLGGAYKPDSTLQTIIIGALYAVLFDKRYDNLAKIKKVKLPLFIAYTKQDMIIPWQMSEALANAAPEGSLKFLSPLGKHENFDWLEKEAIDFLSKSP
jgi:fermentation-respiration switch protein FrsA (DUF1100 family)